MKVTTNYLAGVQLIATGEAFMVAKMVVKRLEDDCGNDLRADDFPPTLIDTEDEVKGAEIQLRCKVREGHSH